MRARTSLARESVSIACFCTLNSSLDTSVGFRTMFWPGFGIGGSPLRRVLGSLAIIAPCSGGAHRPSRRDFYYEPVKCYNPVYQAPNGTSLTTCSVAVSQPSTSRSTSGRITIGTVQCDLTRQAQFQGQARTCPSGHPSHVCQVCPNPRQDQSLYAEKTLADLHF